MGGRTIMSDDEDEVDELEDEEIPRRVQKGDFEGRDEDGDEEEEEEDGQDEYEKDGFIVDDVEEDEEEEENNEDSDEERHRKRKRKKRESERNYVLDEDDYELLQDNNINVHRPKPTSKFKRLKKAGRDLGVVERSGFSDDEESERADISGRTAEEKLKRSLFGDDEGAPFEDIAEEEEQPEEEDGDLMGEDDEMADFIVDEEDVDENGTIMRRPKVKKKKSRQAPGVSSSAIQEAQEIFGDVDELLMLRKQEFSRSSSDLAEKRLEDEFEPFILSEKYMTPKDDAIREIDIAERVQLMEELTGPPPQDDKSIAEESTWIYDQLTDCSVSPLIGEDFELSKDINKEHIGHVLTMLHCQKYDIPFIAKYRREYIRSFKYDVMPVEEDGRIPMRRHKVLWAVHGLDKKWLLLQKRKSALQMYYSKRFEEEARRIDDETRLALNKQIFSSILEALKEAKSERGVDDVDSKFNLHFPPGEIDADDGQFKRPKRKSLYSICYKAGLWEVANKFGFNSEQFGLHLSLEKMRLDELQDGKEVPEEVARNFTCAMFEKAQDVLKGARHMAAVEIGCEPVVRNHVRSIFLNNAVVSTSPTPEGNVAIDVYHQFYIVKSLRDKPLSKFTDAQWLLIQKAEQAKLLLVNIKLPESVQNKLLVDASECYLSECVSKPAQLWNEQRKMILEDSFHNFILPSMEKEARTLLTARAKTWLQMEYGKQLWDKVSVAPYRRKGNADDTDNDDDLELRVMACCPGSGKPPNTFVMLDSTGEVVDIIYAGYLSIRSQGVVEQQRKKGDQERLLRFLTEHQPHVGCMGATNLSAKPLKDDIYEVVFKIVEHHPRDVSQDMNINVLWCDESLPRLYENSRIASDQLPGQAGIVKRAVALGRYLQNPLAMVATLCGPAKEILSWKLCPLDDFLAPDEKYNMVEQIMIDATNHVGVDVNIASSHEWLFAPLQFVSGLGPRKASALQRALVRVGSVFSRKEISAGRFLRKKVFINAAGSLRIRRSGAAAATSHIIDILDDSRIHPESYQHAKEMALVVDSEAGLVDRNEMDEDALEMAIERIKENKETLQTLLISEYASSVLDKEGVDKRETLADIKNELLQGFKEGRYPFHEPNEDEEFSMLSGETDDSLAEGRIVEATVISPQDNRLFCSLYSGLRAYIMADDFSDDGYDPEKVKKGDILTAKIKNVNKNRYVVYLTCKESEMKRRQYIPPSIDPFHHKDDGALHSEQEKARKEKELAKKQFKPRMIIHPRFHNVTADEAMVFLAERDAGESIIRPSSKGPSYLTLTLKISNGVYAHKDIVESGKDHKDMTSLLRIGKTLTIDKDTFEDLDEVMDRYVDPLVTNLKNMLNYRKFRWGSKSDVDDQLRKEKAENPMRIVYSFGISHDHPGTFVLSYIRSSNPHHEYVGLYPKGFRFRKRDFEDIDRLVSYFQKNIDKPPPESGPSIQTVAAKVPMKSPSWAYSGDGSFGGGSNSEGWSNQPSDRERSSTPGSRTGGRGGRDGHPSGLPRPSRGNFRGRGRGSDHGNSKWGSNSNDDDGGLSSFAGAKVQDSPGRERFPGGWGGSSGRGGGGWGGSSIAEAGEGGGGGWSGSGRGGGFGGRGRGNARNGRGGGDSSGSWGGGGGGSSGGCGGDDDAGGGSGGGWGSDSMAGKSPGASESGFGGGSSDWSRTKRLVPPSGSSGGWSGGDSSGGGWD